MTLCADDLEELIIRETLDYLQLGLTPCQEKSAIALLLGTAAQESRLDSLRRCGRRLGLYQISPALHKSVWDNFLVHHPELASRVRGLAGQRSFLANPHGELLSNLRYATAIAMMVYLRTEQPLPSPNDLQAMACFWHRHFHPKASNTTAEFIKNCRGLLPERFSTSSIPTAKKYPKHLVAA